MQIYSTSDLHGRGEGRTAAWNNLYATEMSLVDFMPFDPDAFEAELNIDRLGPIKLARLTVENCRVERSSEDIRRNDARLYNFLLQVAGQSTFHHCGHDCTLDEGDLVLVDTGMPHHWRTAGTSTTIMVRVEPRLLREYLPTPERYCGRRLGAEAGRTGPVVAMVRSLAEAARADGCAAYEDRIARYLLEMIAMAYATGFEGGSGGSAVVWQRRSDIVAYIEHHLRDPELCPAAIARGMRLSPRYLRVIFSTAGERLSSYILRRRIEECARQMRNPAWNAHTITEIAFSWGFNSAAHFTRSFHDQLGIPPRDYRRHWTRASDVKNKVPIG